MNMRALPDPIRASMADGLPMCAQCGKPVHSVERYRDEWKRCTHFIVWCHGEREEFDLDDSFAHFGGRNLEIAEAFVNPVARLEKHE